MGRESLRSQRPPLVRPGAELDKLVRGCCNPVEVRGALEIEALNRLEAGDLDYVELKIKH